MRSLKNFGIVLFVIAGVIPVVVLFFLIQSFGKGGGAKQAEEAQSKLSISVGKQVESLINSSLREAKTLRGNYFLQDPKTDAKLVKEELKRLEKWQFDDASVIDANGQILVTTISSEPKTDSSDWAKSARAEGRPYVSYPLVGGGAGYSVYQSIKPKGNEDGRVIRLDFSFKRIQGILDEVKVASGEELYLTDSPSDNFNEAKATLPEIPVSMLLKS